MKLYSDFALARTRQIAGDLIAATAVVLSVVLGVAVHAFIVTFADLGRQLEGAGNGFRQTMTDAADSLAGVPLIGSGVRAPFDDASGAGAALEQAGRTQQALVGQAAVVAGILVALIPIAVVVRYWLVRRIGFARRASEAASLARVDGGLDLLALRALARRSPSALLAIDPSPTAAWRRGDAAVIRSLAALSLREAGVRGN